MKSLLEITQIAANVATTIGVAGIFVAYWQFREGAKAQRQATALDAWRDYLQLALENPQLAFPSLQLMEGGVEAKDRDRYKWYISLMLFACEQALAANPDDTAWQAAIVNQLKHHRVYLSMPERNFSSYEENFVRLINSAI